MFCNAVPPTAGLHSKLHIFGVFLTINIVSAGKPHWWEVSQSHSSISNGEGCCWHVEMCCCFCAHEHVLAPVGSPVELNESPSWVNCLVLLLTEARKADLVQKGGVAASMWPICHCQLFPLFLLCPFTHHFLILGCLGHSPGRFGSKRKAIYKN